MGTPSTLDPHAGADRPRRTPVEAMLRYPRAVLVGVLLLTTLVSWAWIVLMARDMYGSMRGPAAWMMTTAWDAPHLALLWAMWAVMMAGMMLPSAAPILLLYAGAIRKRSGAPRAALQVYALAAGYGTMWALFSVGATLLQRLLASSWLLTSMMEPATPIAGAAILIVAGLYQMTPLKWRCLQACRSPLSFLARHWRGGRAGAFGLGVRHGAYCLGCCWALMLLLFAGGVMNLFVIGAITAWVLVEKLAPLGEQGARLSGALLLGTAGWMLLR
jgi:predicted metal-binding membrane protein